MPRDIDPARLAKRDQAIAETREDLERLVAAACRMLAETDRDDAVDRLVRGMLDEPAWGRLELCTVLGLALVDLAMPRTGRPS